MLRLMFIFSVGFALGNATSAASTWTQYRGSNHDAYYAAPIRTNWTGEAPRVLWRTPMPAALSSLSVANGRLFTMGLRRHLNQDREFCIALNADTGAELWATPIDIADYPDGGVGSDEDRKSTRLNSSHGYISYAVFCLKKKNTSDQFLGLISLTHVINDIICFNTRNRDDVYLVLLLAVYLVILL